MHPTDAPHSPAPRRRRRRSALGAAALAVLALTGPVALEGAASASATTGWRFEIADPGRPGSLYGVSPAAVEYAGQPHSFSYGDGGLRHAWKTSTGWHVEVLDGKGGPDGRVLGAVGFEPSAALVGGRPHVWYLATSTYDLRHAWWTGSRWRFETLDGAGGPDGRIAGHVGWQSSVVVDDGVPHVWYREGLDPDPDMFGRLRHAWWTGSTWRFESFDGAGRRPGQLTTDDVGTDSTAVLYGGHPHVFYGAEGLASGWLRHAWWTGSVWRYETLDGRGGPDGRVVDGVNGGSAVLFGGRPHVFYSDGVRRTLRHAWWTGARWRFEVLDGAGGPHGQLSTKVGVASTAVVSRGGPHVWYCDVVGENLRHAWWNGTGWRFATLDGEGGPAGRTTRSVGDFGNAAVLVGGRPRVFYQDHDQQVLRTAAY